MTAKLAVKAIKKKRYIGDFRTLALMIISKIISATETTDNFS